MKSAFKNVYTGEVLYVPNICDSANIILYTDILAVLMPSDVLRTETKINIIMKLQGDCNLISL